MAEDNSSNDPASASETPNFAFGEPTVAQTYEERRRSKALWSRRAVDGMVGDCSGRRLWATQADFLLAAISSMCLVISLPDFAPLWKGLSFYVFFLLYYQLMEYFTGTTPAKWWFGLRVRSRDGSRASFMQVGIRTLMRVIEINPIFMGFFPAGLFIALTKRHIRLGDMLAGTLVVRVESM